MLKKIRVTRSSMPPFDEYIEEIRSIWDSRWLTNFGEKHQKLASELSEFLKTEGISLFSNGHLALEYLLEAFELKGEVVTTPFTFASTTHAIVRKGLVPVFCDIRDSDCNIDVEKIEPLITEKTCAIIPVHVFGNPCDVVRIDQIAKKHGLIVIYDAAHAFGIELDGRGISNFGDASMFSFHATKVFHTIEGGAAVSRNGELIRKLECLKNYGIDGPESVGSIGGNAKMNEFQAAMGICNLRHIEEEIEFRKTAAERYYTNLDGIKGIKTIMPSERVKYNYAYLPILIDGYKATRDEVFEALGKESVYARKYFYPLTNSFKCYDGLFDESLTPIADHIANSVLTLPLFSGLENDEIDNICNIIKGV